MEGGVKEGVEQETSGTAQSNLTSNDVREVYCLRVSDGKPNHEWVFDEQMASDVVCLDLVSSETVEEGSDVEESAKEREDGSLGEYLDSKKEAEVKADAGNLGWRERIILEALPLIQVTKKCLLSIVERIVAEWRFESSVDVEAKVVEDESDVLLCEIRSVHKLGMYVGSMFTKYEELWKKERKELVNSNESLIQENKDTLELLRVAITEKEVVEEALAKVKANSEKKRMPILQYAERGLQKVGFGFLMGSSATEYPFDGPGSSCDDTKFDSSQVDESVSLTSAVGKIMKNLRHENTNLKRNLDESRLDCNIFQKLADKQAQHITERTAYIKHLEEKETLLNENIIQLKTEIKEVEEDASRWREACELEVEAGKRVIDEHERNAAILQEELKRTNAALDDAKNKLLRKEKLVATAMAAQAAAETSLRMADSRLVLLSERIEELTKQLEEETKISRTEEQTTVRRKIRHVCWPWPAPRINPSIGQSSHSSRRLPEMLPLLQ